MDEIFGYFPPVSNPPSKRPLLTLLKQARAFGVGVVLATQNPVDLDYKGLANAGTWFIGRLQTERDKQRLIEGLEGAASEGSQKFDRARTEEILAGLGKRVFLMNNVHEDAPVAFEKPLGSIVPTRAADTDADQDSDERPQSRGRAKETNAPKARPAAAQRTVLASGDFAEIHSGTGDGQTNRLSAGHPRRPRRYASSIRKPKSTTWKTSSWRLPFVTTACPSSGRSASRLRWLRPISRMSR